ncbi:MAG: hypothetical protein ACYC0C_17290 [Devosia sp.]
MTTNTTTAGNKVFLAFMQDAESDHLFGMVNATLADAGIEFFADPETMIGTDKDLDRLDEIEIALQGAFIDFAELVKLYKAHLANGVSTAEIGGELTAPA